MRENPIFWRLDPCELFEALNSDLDGIYNAIVQAQQETSKPTLIKLKTIIGYGSLQQGTHGVHGSRKFVELRI